MKFAFAAEKYLLLKERSEATKVNLRKLRKHFGPNTNCDKIKQNEIDEAGLKICPGSKPRTRLRQVTAPAKAILTFAANREWCPPPKFEAVEQGGKRTDWLTPAQAEAMIAGAAPHLKPLVTFLFSTGCRVGEAIALDWQDVNLEYARVVLRNTKNGDDRPVSLPPRAVKALASLPLCAGRVFLRPVSGDSAKKMVPYRDTDDGETTSYGGQIKKA